MYIRNIILIFISSLFLFSCDDFLDVEPRKSSDRKIETVEDLDLVLSNPLGHHNWRNNHLYCTDNFVLPTDIYEERPNGYERSQIQNYLWETEINESEDRKWNLLYQYVWDANMIINAVDNDNVTGNGEQKAIVKAEAHLLRAYCFFELALAYSLHPTQANMNELGIVLRLGTDFEEDLSRASIAETYAQIEADIIEALKITVSERISWRASKPAVDAFAARYYLYRSDYDKAKQYADAALGSYSEMINFETEISLFTEGDFEYPSTQKSSSFTPADFLDFWKEQYQFKYTHEFTGLLYPSQELLDLYDTNDLRFEYFIVEDFSKYRDHEEALWPGYVVSHPGQVVTGPSVSEMYYIRAECNARGQGSVAEAMADIEMVRVNRFAAANYTAMEIPANQKEAVELIIDERRREFPFSLRWYDIRRINTDDLLDPITISRTFFPVTNGDVTDLTSTKEYVLDPGSRLYARPLGNDVIYGSNGVTAQNEY